MISKDYQKRIERAITSLNIRYRNTTDQDERQSIQDDLETLMQSYKDLNNEFISFNGVLKYTEDEYGFKNSLS